MKEKLIMQTFIMHFNYPDFRARSLVVSEQTKGSRFQSGCKLYELSAVRWALRSNRLANI